MKTFPLQSLAPLRNSLKQPPPKTSLRIIRTMATAESQGKPPYPPFTIETAQIKVKAAQDAWNTKYVDDPTCSVTQRLSKYTYVITNKNHHPQGPRQGQARLHGGLGLAQP